MIKTIGARELIHDLLGRFDGEVEVDEIRKYAVGLKGDYKLAASFIPTTADGMLSFDSIEEELRLLRFSGKIEISDGIVRFRQAR
jgi:hypothetical protein